MSSHLVLHTRVVRGSGGGPDKTILNSPRFLEHKGYPMLCAYMRHPRDPGFIELEQRARKWGAPLLPVDDFGPLDWGVVTRLRRICLEHRPVIWHGHDYKSNLLGLLARRAHTMRLVTTVHGWVDRNRRRTSLYYALDRLCLRYYDEVISVSSDLYDKCLNLGISKDHSWLVPNAIDTEEFHRSEPRESAKLRQGVDPNRFLIGAIGRLSAEKGFHLLIEALQRLVLDGFDSELWIAGEGDQRGELERLVAELGLSERVKLPGFCSDTLPLYHSLDVFASSSLREGLPNVLLEAMALEIPVLSTRVAGVPGLIRDNENGLLVEAGSVDALVLGLKRLLQSRELRNRLGSAARQTVEESYSFGRRMDAIRAIYDKTLKGPGGTR